MMCRKVHLAICVSPKRLGRPGAQEQLGEAGKGRGGGGGMTTLEAL